MKIRRVVTAHENGKSTLSFDGKAPGVHDLGGGMRIADIWKVHETPVNLRLRDDAPELGDFTLAPPPGGNVLRIADFPPEKEGGTSVGDARDMFEKMSAATASTGEKGNSGSALMHQTETLDYGVVLEGEITMLLDEEEVHLEAGDVVIQRGTNHAWVNRSASNCRMLFVLIDGCYKDRTTEAI